MILKFKVTKNGPFMSMDGRTSLKQYAPPTFSNFGAYKAPHFKNIIGNNNNNNIRMKCHLITGYVICPLTFISVVSGTNNRVSVAGDLLLTASNTNNDTVQYESRPLLVFGNA